MNLLIVSSWCPFPPDNGSRLRAFNLLRQLAARGHTLTLLALAQPDTDAARAMTELSELCAGGVQVFPNGPHPPAPSPARGQRGRQRPVASGILPSPVPTGEGRHSYGGVRASFLSPLPHSVLLAWNADMAGAVHTAVQSGDYDRALFLEPGVLPYAPARPGVPCILDCMEVSRFVRQTRTVRVRLMLWKLRRYLRAYAPRFSAWTAVSDMERDTIAAFVGRHAPPLFVLPNGVDLGHNAFTKDAPTDADRLVLNGAPDFAPNAEGAAWFASHVLPLVQQTRPGAHLWVTGRADSLPASHSLRHVQSLTLTGFLDDVRPAVQGASVCVVPLFAGGGTRLKILESMALGTPVVSTTLGAEGIGAVDGEHILLADTPADFARAVLSLMADTSLRERVRLSARRLMEQSYGWDGVGARLDTLLRNSLCR